MVVVVKEQKPAGKPFQQKGQMFRIVKVLCLMCNGSAKDGDASFQVLQFKIAFFQPFLVDRISVNKVSL
jgi:hypothetical protein